MAKKARPAAPISPELLAAIFAAPDDDAPRGVLADALIEVGDPRGEFIAVQLEIARHDGGKPTARTRALWDRFRKLHASHAAKWAKPLRALGGRTRWEFHRGFVRRLRLEAPGPKQAAIAAVLAVEPVTHLDLDRVEVEWIEKALPLLAGVRRLAIVSTDIANNPRLARALAAAELPNLVELRVGLLGDEPVQALGAMRAPVTHLALGCGGHGVALAPSVLRELLASPLGTRLATLEIGRSAITPSMRAMILGSRLARFSASDGEVYGDDDPRDPTHGLAELRARFGAGFVLEDEPSFDYLLDGVAGLTKLAPPWKR